MDATCGDEAFGVLAEAFSRVVEELTQTRREFMKEADLLHTCEDPTELLGKETPKEAADILKWLEDECN